MACRKCNYYKNDIKFIGYNFCPSCGERLHKFISNYNHQNLSSTQSTVEGGLKLEFKPSSIYDFTRKN